MTVRYALVILLPTLRERRLPRRLFVFREAFRAFLRLPVVDPRRFRAIVNLPRFLRSQHKPNRRLQEASIPLTRFHPTAFWIGPSPNC